MVWYINNVIFFKSVFKEEKKVVWFHLNNPVSLGEWGEGPQTSCI